jgi:hypothetical protein
MPAAFTLSHLQALKAQLGTLERVSRESVAWSKLIGGLPRGALVEIAGPGKTEAVASLLAEHKEARAAWIEKEFTLLPSALPQRGVELEQIFFIESGAESEWAAGLVLRSQLFPFLVYHAPCHEEKTLRRFQLLAERSRSTMLLLAEKGLSMAWPIALSLEAKAGSLEVRRRK